MEQPTFTDEQKANLRRLAEAMRAGAALRPQATGVLFRKHWTVNKSEMQSCALGAAWEGSHPGFDPHKWLMDMDANDPEFIGLTDVENYFGLMNLACNDPFMHEPTTTVVSVIITMNDRKGYTREMIADWLLTLAQ